MKTRALALAALLAACPLWAAETDFRGLSMPERSALGHEIRDTLMADPELVLPAFSPPTPGYKDAIDADLQMLTDLADQIFAAPIAGDGDAPRLALVTTPDCAPCADFRALLTGWASQGRLRLYDLPLSSATATALGLDTAPSFVFETLIVRGDVPPVVLEKYLSKQSG
ncbi:hypothetical protein [Thalassovita sp.]|uniref:hypothetical protein n=1 Tax=Thalassovita sp. TaxID=1979401 RepID=UPI0029DE51C7|nr:hypothetical protein [Thalassovita sp.]